MIRSTEVWRAVAALAAAAAWRCRPVARPTTATATTGGGGGGEAACDLTLAFFGPQTGPAAGLGAPIINGAQLAIDQYNADADCEVGYEQDRLAGQPGPGAVAGHRGRRRRGDHRHRRPGVLR